MGAVILGLLPLFLASRIVAAAPPFSITDLWSIERISESQTSPKGEDAAYVVKVAKPDMSGLTGQIWVHANGNARPFTTHEKGASRPRWSPDGRSIAYLSRESGTSQIWVRSLAGGESRQVTRISTGADNHQWSPDGRQLFFTSDVWPDLAGDEAQKSRQEGIDRSGVKARVIDGLLYRHWNEWREGKRTHVFSVPVEGGTGDDLTPGDADAPPFSMGGPDGFAVSPDGRELVFTRGPIRPGTSSSRDYEAWSTDANLWVRALPAGSPRCITAINPGWDGSPVYSPDGRHIAYRSQAREGYEADRFRLAVYDRSTAQTRYLASSLDRSVDDMLWHKEGRSIFILTEHRGASAIYEIPLSEGRQAGPEKLVFSGSHLAGWSMTASGDALLVETDSLIKPSELARLPLRPNGASDAGHLIPVTRHNAAWLEGISMPSVRSIEYPGSRGRKIQAWLLTPPGHDESKRLPMILLIHGGPQSAWRDAFSYRWCAALFAARGYLVLMPNPHGSTGFGQAFTEQISGDWGGACYRDLMRGVDWAIDRGLADKDKLSAMGGSFGGYMVNWMLGHTDRFKAMVSHAGVFNLESKYGTTEELWFPEWDLEGTPWKHRGSYTRFSPHRWAGRFKTPVLVTHGELDFRVPVDQGLQLFTALKRQGVESRLLYFPDEGHWILKPRNSRLFYETVLEWLDRHLK